MGLTLDQVDDKAFSEEFPWLRTPSFINTTCRPPSIALRGEMVSKMVLFPQDISLISSSCARDHGESTNSPRVLILCASPWTHRGRLLADHHGQ